MLLLLLSIESDSSACISNSGEVTLYQRLVEIYGLVVCKLYNT